MSQINIYNEPSAEVIIDENGTPVTVIIATSGAGGAVWGTITGTLSDQTDLQNALNAKVPYSGATGNVNLGEYGISAGYVQLDTTPSTYTPAVGNIGYNDNVGTLETTLKGGNVQLKIGRDMFERVVNKTGVQLTKAAYQAVRVSDAQGQRLAVDLAQANNDNNSADTIGLAVETIDNNQEGNIFTVGEITGIDTTGSLQGETWVDGDVLYLSPTVAGRITNVKPIAPQHLVVIGYVVYSHANNGKIYVKVMNGWELGELHDVDTTGATNGQVLKYNGTIWAPSADAGITGSGIAGQVAYWSGTNTQAGSNNLFWDNANGRLGIGTNAPASSLQIASAATLATGIQFNNAGSIGHIWGDGASMSMRAGNTHGIQVNAGSAGLNSSAGGTGGFRIELQILTNSPLYTFTSDANTGIGRTADDVLTFYSGGERARFTSGGNLLLNQTTDGGQRLQVTGDTLLKGSGNTSGTTALTVQNSDGNNILRIRNDGFYLFGNSSNRPLFATVSGISTPSISGTALQFSIDNSVSRTTTGFDFLITYGTRDYTSGTVDVHRETATFSPTSGTGVFNKFVLNPTINQTGGANGITRGLYLNPTLTAAADWRSVEWSNNTGWGLYGAGTATNYLGGSLGIGTTTLNNSALRVNKAITGAVTQSSIANNSTINSDVTSNAWMYTSSPSTQASSFTLSELVHFNAFNLTIGLGSSITNNIGFKAESNLTGATNNYGFFGNIASGTGRWNLYMGGTAANYMNGNLLLGSTTDGGQKLQVTGNAIVTGDLTVSKSGITTFTFAGAGAFQYDVISTGAQLLYTSTSGTFRTKFAGNNFGMIVGATSATQTSAVTLLIASRADRANNIFESSVSPQFSSTNQTLSTISLSATVSFDPTNNTTGSIHSGIRIGETFAPNTANKDIRYIGLNIASTINQSGGLTQITRGLYVNPTLTAAADWRSIEWSNSTGWGLYGAGTANNYLAGGLGIGSTNLTGVNLRVAKTLTGAVGAYGVEVSSQIQSDVTAQAYSFLSNPSTQNSIFTLGTIAHFVADQGTFGASSTVQNQVGFRARSTLIGGTISNYGFRGEIPSGTGRWNLYMDGTALNHLNGSLLIGTTTDAGFKLDVNGTARVQGALTISNTSIGTITGGNEGNSRPIQFTNNGTTGGWNGGYTFSGGHNGNAGVVALRIYSNGTSNSNNRIGIGSITDLRLQNLSDVRLAVQGRVASGSEPNYEDSAVFYSDGSSYTYSNGKIFGILLGSSDGGIIPTSNINNFSVNLGYQVHPLTNGFATSMIMSAKADSGTMNEVMRVMGRNQSVGIGVTQTTNLGTKLQVGGSVTASSAIAQGLFVNTTLVASANNDVLVGVDINPTFTNGAFTGVVNTALRIQNGNLNIVDRDVVLSATTGTKIGTATSQKLGFFNATPVVQRTTAVAGAARVGGGGTTVTDTDTFGGYTIAQLVTCLKDLGLIA